MDDIINKEHSVNYAKGVLTVTGVKEVDSFEDKEVILKLGTGGMVVKGSGLAVSELSVSSGTLRVTGVIESISYNKVREKQNFFKKLFK